MSTQELTITREAGNQPWGFRLQGGKDFNMPIIIQKVNGGSPAERAGMRAGDAVLAIGGSSAIEMRHKEAQDNIVRSGNSIRMTVQRGGLASLRPPSSAPTVIKPSQPVRNRNPFRVIQNVETPDGKVRALVHNQHNSPLPLYSEEKIAETISAQTEVLAGGALGVDFKKNEKAFDGNMSEVLKMVQDMDNQPEAYKEPSEDILDASALPGDYTGLNSIKSRAMRSLVVHADGQPAAAHSQSNVHAPRISPSQHTTPAKIPPPVAPKPAMQMAPQPAPQVAPPSHHVQAPTAGAPGRGPPGLRSTSATLIKADPVTGAVKLSTAVDTEVRHFNAFNRTPQSFKAGPSAPSHQPAPAPGYAPAPAPSYAPAPAPGYSAPAPAPSYSAPAPMHRQQGAVTSNLSQVDYTSYVPQRKGGTNFVWPPPAAEPNVAPPVFAGGYVEVSPPGQHSYSSAPVAPPAPAPPSNMTPPVVPKPAPPPVLPKPAVSFAPPSAPSAPKQVSFGQPSFAPKPTPAPAGGGAPKLNFNGGLPGLGNIGAGGGGSSGKGAMAGRANAPRRGRGQMNPAATGSRVPMCATCGAQIRGPFITALGQCWCPHCFTCATPQCGQSLEFIGFVEVDGNIHCENCWERHLAPVCNKCNSRIKEDCLKAIGNAYHPECFACAYCGGLFGNSAFFLEDGLPYCENDWNELFTTKCVGCGFPIEAGDRWVEALNKNFHSQCFKCAMCRCILDGQQFYAKAGRAVCRAHAGKH